MEQMGPTSVPQHPAMVDGESNNFDEASFAAVSHDYLNSVEGKFDKRDTLTKSQRVPSQSNNFAQSSVGLTRKNTL